MLLPLCKLDGTHIRLYTNVERNLRAVRQRTTCSSRGSLHQPFVFVTSAPIIASACGMPFVPVSALLSLEGGGLL